MSGQDTPQHPDDAPVPDAAQTSSSPASTAPAPPELPEDWWTTADVLTYLASIGRRMTRGTWASYVSRGSAPRSERQFGNSSAWRPQTIRSWAAEGAENAAKFRPKD